MSGTLSYLDRNSELAHNSDLLRSNSDVERDQYYLDVHSVSLQLAHTQHQIDVVAYIRGYVSYRRSHKFHEPPGSARWPAMRQESSLARTCANIGTCLPYLQAA